MQVGISGGDVIFGGEVRGKGGEGLNRVDGGGIGKGLGRAAVVQVAVGSEDRLVVGVVGGGIVRHWF